MRYVPAHIRRPLYAEAGLRGWLAGKACSFRTDFGWRRARQRTRAEAQALRRACRLAREVLDAASLSVRAGVSTAEIDAVVHEATVSRNAYPSPLGYRGFPASCCTSVNDEVAHGVPGSRVLAEGDLINVDVTVYSEEGFHGDCSETFFVPCGDLDRTRSARRLAKATYGALNAAIAHCRPGLPYASIGKVIDAYLDPTGYASVEDFCGHGIGREFHMRPRIWHFRHIDLPLIGEGLMELGHSFTIEPMVVEGQTDVELRSDGWTAVTSDGSLCAQFEHTLLLTDAGAEVLTARLPTSPALFFQEE